MHLYACLMQISNPLAKQTFVQHSMIHTAEVLFIFLVYDIVSLASEFEELTRTDRRPDIWRLMVHFKFIEAQNPSCRIL